MNSGLARVPSEALYQGLRSARRYAEELFKNLYDGTRDPAGGVTRSSYGTGEQYAHELMAAAAQKMGLEIDRDKALNTYMTLPGRDRSLPRIIIGSHLDSVARGGNFDGAAGVVAGLAAIHALQACAMQPREDVTVMGVRAEESAWFQTSYIGSKAALGLLEPSALASVRVDTQRSLAQHIAELGGDPQALLSGQAYLQPRAIKAYLELHIEQAPSLVEKGHRLAVGSAIPGNVRYPSVHVSGNTDHVGLPLRFRRDALKAAAGFVTHLEDLWRSWDEAGIPMALTVGRFHTDSKNDAMTKVPGSVRFSMDMRAYDEAQLAKLEQEALSIAARTQELHGVKFDFGVRTTAAVAKSDMRLSNALLSLAMEEGLSIDTLPSPASHDAAVFCSAGVPMGLLLIRNENGSHNPDEAMEMDDFMAGVTVLTRWLLAGQD